MSQGPPPRRPCARRGLSDQVLTGCHPTCGCCVDVPSAPPEPWSEFQRTLNRSSYSDPRHSPCGSMMSHECSPGLQLEERDGKGRCLVATRRFIPGELVLRVAPFRAALHTDQMALRCDFSWALSSDLRKCGKTKVARYASRSAGPPSRHALRLGAGRTSSSHGGMGLRSRAMPSCAVLPRSLQLRYAWQPGCSGRPWRRTMKWRKSSA